MSDARCSSLGMGLDRNADTDRCILGLHDASSGIGMGVVGLEMWRGYYDSAVGSVYRCAVSFGLWSHYHLFTSHVVVCARLYCSSSKLLFCPLPSESSIIEWSVCFINAVCNYCICITNKATWAVST